jgi:hypothetical protein
MIRSCRLLVLILAGLFTAPAVVGAEVFQFEFLAASSDWVVVRENIPASVEDTAACSYPGLDPSRYVGATVHFFPVSADAKRGWLMPLEKPTGSMPLFAHGRLSEGCTSTADAERQWGDIVAHAKKLGIEIPSTLPAAAILGEAVPANACVLLGSAPIDKPPCRREFSRLLKMGAIRIAVSLRSIPEAPNERFCQFVGHRFGAAIQVAGFDFGKTGSGVAPGGFANHYECRSQQFDPLRLYVLDGRVALIASFSGTNIADRTEYPFVMLFPTKPVR